MYILHYRKFFYIISGALVAGSFLAILMWGIPLGIDFKGGSLLEIEYVNTRPDIQIIKSRIASLDLGNVLIQETGERGILLRAKEITEEVHQEVLVTLSDKGKEPISEKRFTSIGPVIGKELQEKALISIVLVVILIIVYIAFTFRHVSKPINSWTYGLIAVLALVHDVTIPTGVFAFLGKFSTGEVDTLFVTALLTILGLSVNDSIVVFDRIRENLRLRIGKTFEETVGISLRQTITRSINTSLTIIIVLFAIYFFGPESTKHFSLVLIIGLIVGAYSSIFIASPLLVDIAKRLKK